MAAGRTPRPKLSCNFCGHVVGKGAIWCSTDCAKDYEAERNALTVEGG
jgi:predicted nucleic acid-binding Zn ribbon protein